MVARLLLALAFTSIFGASMTVESLAVFADSESNAANVMSTGSVSISDAPDTAFLVVANMAPGDTSVTSLVVTNNGSLPLRYALTSSSTNDDAKGLAAQMQLNIRTLGTSCVAQDGAVLYSGALSAAAFGSVVQGAQAGDRDLVAGASETLCFRVEFPLASGDAFQSATTTTTFTLSAEQTTNNP